MHRDSENFIKYQGGLQFQSLRAVSVWRAGVKRGQIDADVSGTKRGRKKQTEAALTDTSARDTHGPHTCAHTPLCSTARVQNFNVFWKRSFSQLRVSPKNLRAPGDQGEKPNHKEKTSKSVLRTSGELKRRFCFYHLCEKTSALISPRPLAPSPSSACLASQTARPPRHPPGWAPGPVHPQHGSQHPGEAPASVE